MRLTAITCSLALAAPLSGKVGAADQDKQLYGDLVSQVLAAKCASCHGEDKQKGKLRVDSFGAILEGGNEGPSVVAGKPDDSPILQRVYLPLDDDDHMPPEDKDQLTEQETALLEFWVQSGAKEKGSVADLKPDEETAKAIAHVADNLPEVPESVAKADVPKVDPAKEKLVEETVGRISETGASLMPIAQNTPELRYSALNISKDFTDDDLTALKPIADLIKWMDLARTGVTDKGLSHLSGMENLTRLHLENTGITDAGLDAIKVLPNLEYLNLYGTKVTDAGIAKLSGAKSLKKLFLWQSKATEAGAKKLAAAIPGLDVNTGWKESEVEPVALAANTKAEPKKETPPAKPEPKKEAAKPEPKKDAKKPAPKPEPKKPDPTFQKALDELKAAVEKTSKEASQAKAELEAAVKAVAEATKKAEALKAESEKAATVAVETKSALDQLEKAATASK